MMKGDWQRFASRFTAGNGCWVWTGGSTAGYGQFSIGGSTKKVHRVAYEFFVGPIPQGYTIHHHCGTKKCIRPSHLEVMTQGRNNRQPDATAGMNLRKTHCKRGHEYTPKNTMHRRGSRGCRTCINQLQRERRARKKAAR